MSLFYFVLLFIGGFINVKTLSNGGLKGFWCCDTEGGSGKPLLSFRQNLFIIAQKRFRLNNKRV